MAKCIGFRHYAALLEIALFIITFQTSCGNSKSSENQNRGIAGTFSGEEGSGSTITITFNPNGTCLLSQRKEIASGTYKILNVPFPEKGNGNIYYEIQPGDGKENEEELEYKTRVGFYSPKSDSFFIIVGEGARQRLLDVGPHAEFAIELKREH